MAERMREKVALITGAAGGLGLTSAILFSKEEATTIIMTDVNEDHMKQAAREVEKMGKSQVLTYKLDVSNEQDWKTIINDLENKVGKIDVLVNNAGINKRDTYQNCSLEDWNHIISVNQTGVFLGMKHCLELLKKSGNASIINLSSITGMTGYFAVAYTASKWAVRGMTKSAAMEFGEFGIRVNSIHPGFIWTPFNESINDIILASNEMNALGRGGEPMEVANAILFLASDESSFMTGSEVVVDGGLTSGGQFKSIAKRFDIY
ncbi:SDR family oxidoreductase [Bacillus sp. V3B]|uniref:SDR family NAD(P)-dependent oxidoreductase n=1 Tax=Bacillus sp. V3B TaxID=2804915 RepID=UPI00210A3FEE|nr:SDR family oxidoreductase [Bacillus sp. V3B]MCQ6277113.1 SDR family oxidoreductase [Bacillus sp. V3B]